MTVSKLVWPVSSGAAVLVASCPSELPVPWVVDTSATHTEYANKIPPKIFTHYGLIKCNYLQLLDMGFCNEDL